MEKYAAIWRAGVYGSGSPKAPVPEKYFAAFEVSKPIFAGAAACTDQIESL